VPAGVVTAVGIVIAASAVASAEAAPSLPAKTAAQLLAAIGSNGGKPLGPLTATVQRTADLGLPQLPSAGPQREGASSSPLAGAQSIRIWYRDPQHIRLAEPVQDGETDYRLSGRTLWVWDSSTQTATKIALPASAAFYNGNVAVQPRRPLSRSAGKHAPLPDSPIAAANQVLKAVGPTTVVSVQRNLYVAGRAAYQLALVPKSSQSLVGKVLIAVDASKYIPLRVQVFARGSASPAYAVGFTSLSFGRPAASNFSFTPPPGATVKTQTVPANPRALLPKGLNPASLGGASPAAAGPAKRGNGSPKTAQPGNNGGAAVSLRRQAAAPQVIGKSWLSVFATPASPQVAAQVRQLLSASGGPHAQPPRSVMLKSSSSDAQAYSSNLSVSFPGAVAGQDAALLRALLLASTPVHGSWGSGRLLQTKLLSVLVTSDGRILAGAVTPAQLYRDVAVQPSSR